MKRYTKPLEVKKIKKIFYKLFERKKEYDVNNINHKICYLASRFIKYEILLSRGQIEKSIKNLYEKWFFYLFNRIYKAIDVFSEKVLREIYADYPIGDLEIYQNVMERVLFNIKRLSKKVINLFDMLNSNQIHPWKKILEFENWFRFDFAVFLIRSGFFGDEIAKHEGNKDYGKDLNKIFQLNNNNERSPPIDVEKEIIRLKYVRNAISHPERAGIRYNKKKNIVKILNYSTKQKKYTYQEKLKVIDLWDIYYKLTILDREFISAALAISILKDLS